MSLLHYHRHHKLLDHLPPPSVMPFLERVRAPEHACTVDYRRHPSTSSIELGLPDFKTLLEDINGGGTAGAERGTSLRGWNPLTAPRSSSNNPPAEDTATTALGAGLGDDLLDAADVFQPFDPFAQDPWTLPKLLQAEIDDDFPYASVNSTQEIEGRRHIEYVANKLHISCEPEHWSSSDVCRWLNWLLQQYSSTSCDVRDDEWSLTGAQLCQLSIADVHDRFPRDGGFVLAELQLWKNFGPLVSTSMRYDTDSSSSPYSGAMHLSLSGDMSCLNYTLLESAAAVDPSLTSFHLSDSNNTSSSSSSGGSSFIVDRYPLLLSPHKRRMMSQSPEAGLLASTDSTLARLHNQPAYQHRSSVHPLCWHTPSSVMSSPCQPAAVCVKSEVIQLPSNGVDENRSSADSWSYVSPSTVSAVSYYPRQTQQYAGKAKWASPSSMTSHVSDFRPTTSRGRGGGNKRTICLWQFLRELLHNPQMHHNWIRWVDKNKGIFKIEDSVRVAKMWGERKNRPQMNYDKLSRSIRQYYKKGIIKKTVNSKRLVYQFCPAYLQ